MGKEIHRRSLKVARDRPAGRAVAHRRWIQLNNPFDDDQRNGRPTFPYGHPVNPDVTLHWEAGNTLGLLDGQGTFANGTTINAQTTTWPLDFTVNPLLPAVTFKIYVKGQADNVTGEKAVDNIHGRVVNVDLDVDANYDGKIDEKDEPLEETRGGIVCVCTNNLTPINLKLEPANLPGKLTLSVAGGGGIRVWQGATPLTLPKTWPANAFPSALSVEGTNASATARDVELRLEYNENPVGLDNPLFKCADIIRLTVIKVELTNIKFNHNTASSTNDALNIRKDYTTGFRNIYGESAKGLYNNPVCYTTNKAVTIEARFIVQPASITNADIWALSTDSGGSLGDVIKTNVTFSGGESRPIYVTFQISGTTPNCIQKTTNDVWQWKMDNVNGTGFGACDINTSGAHTVYTILNEPATPWVNTAGNALNVWTRILEKSCSWANGCAAGSAVLSNIVTQSYSMGVVYDGAQHYTYPGYTQFHLQILLDDMDAAGTDTMDCRDFANWTHTLSGSVGESVQYRVVDRTSSPYYFTYNYILRSGHSNWNTANWNFHQVGWWNSRVCDASLKLDNDSDPTQGPGNSNHVEKLSVGDMTQTDYLDKLTETPDVTDIETGTCVLQ